jgi:hypothetical protein
MARAQPLDAAAEICAGLHEVNRRLQALTPRILAKLDAPLLAGEWRVHDALCHLAADSNWVPHVLGRVEAARAGRGQELRAGFDLDAFNRRRIERRRLRQPRRVIDEALAGHAAAATAIAAIDAGTLAVVIADAPFGPPAPAVQVLRSCTWLHARDHLDDIEKALAV